MFSIFYNRNKQEILNQIDEEREKYKRKYLEISRYTIDVLESKDLDEAMDKYGDLTENVRKKVIDVDPYKLNYVKMIEFIEELKFLFNVCDLAILVNDDNDENKQDLLDAKNIFLENAKLIHDHLRPPNTDFDDLENPQQIQDYLKQQK